MLAIIQGHQATALLLMESRADVNQASLIGSTPLMSAVGTGAAVLAEALLASGAAVDAPQSVPRRLLDSRHSRMSGRRTPVNLCQNLLDDAGSCISLGDLERRFVAEDP
jgi:ankyrin repeat protein